MYYDCELKGASSGIAFHQIIDRNTRVAISLLLWKEWNKNVEDLRRVGGEPMMIRIDSGFVGFWSVSFQ